MSGPENYILRNLKLQPKNWRLVAWAHFGQTYTLTHVVKNNRMCSYVACTQLHQQMETNIVVGQRRLYKGHTVCEDYVHAMMCP